MTHLNDISKVYLEQISESAVPGKPAERLGAVTAIPKSEQEAAKERLLAKTAAKRAKMKEETEIDEAVKGADPEMRKAASDERRAGDKRLSPSTGKGYADQQKQQISYMDKITKKNKNVVGLVTKEALDPVGQEDTDVDNDGKKNTKSDKYLLNRRKAIGKEIAKEAKVYDPMEDDDFDHDEAEENRGVSGKNNPKGGKALGSKKKSVKEGFSDWRKDLGLFEINATDEEDQKQIKEKKVSNVVKTSGLKVQEAVEEIGGTLLEMVEVDEFDFVVEGAYLELLEEGYDEDEIEEALEYALTEAKVTFGHDTASKPEKKKASLLATAREKLSGAKASAKAAVARGARKVAKGALGVARKMEGGKEAPKTAERKPSTYRGAGAGTKERVSSGSYTPPTKKKAEKPSDPWEGSATTPPKAKAKKSAAPKAKATAAPKRKRKSKLDDLLASVRSESVVRDRAKNAVGDDRLDAEQEKTNASMDKLRKQTKRFDRASASDAARKVERDVKKSSAYGPQRPKPGTVTGRRIEDPKPTGSKPKGYRVEEIEIDEDAGIISGLAGLALGAKGASYAAKHTKRMRDYPKNFVKGIVDPRTYVSKKKNDQKEEVQIDEKITAKTDMGAAIKDFYASKSPQLAGRTKEERRKAAIAAVLTARRGGRKLNAESMESNAPLSPAEIQAQKQKARLDLKIANLRNKELTKKNQSEV